MKHQWKQLSDENSRADEIVVLCGRCGATRLSDNADEPCMVDSTVFTGVDVSAREAKWAIPVDDGTHIVSDGDDPNAVNEFLDSIGVPRAFDNGVAYSLIGRIGWLEAQRMNAESESAQRFKCATRPWAKADPPQDCDWPFCGCDPIAARVIALLEECNLLKARER